jgi:hypothetical protein
MNPGQIELDAAVARVEGHADARWKRLALSAIEYLARCRASFTTDDVWEMLGGLDVSTHEPRAMGAMMRQAKKKGWVVGSNTYRPSKRPECHRRPMMVWVSLIKEEK